MTRSWRSFLVILGATICLSSVAPLPVNSGASSGAIAKRAVAQGLAVEQSQSAFRDHTQEIVRRALALIDRNEREGAPLDQRWYAFRRFGDNFDQILKAKEVRFFGGQESEVLNALADQYVSVNPIEADQDPSEVRLFEGRRETDGFDMIIIGQNGGEVALKTVIRLVYLFKFMNKKDKALPGGLNSFLAKLKVYLSSTPPRQEFVSFFQRYHIRDPDAVIIGFQGDTRAVLKEAGIDPPQRYSNDSLRVNWYPKANGKRVLLVSINGNRIFASRAGELIEAIFDTFHSPPATLAFLGSAGAIDSANLIGKIVAPTVVVSDNVFNSADGKLAHIICNRAAALVPTRAATISVQSVAVETMQWAALNKQRRIRAVDQELYHVINAINAYAHADQIQLYVGMFVTDNVSALPAPHAATLQHAEDVIARTAAVRKKFLAKVLAAAGVIPQESKPDSAVRVNCN